MERRRATSAALAALAALAAAAPAADASTAGVQATTLTVTGSSGERNRLAVSRTGSELRITDGGATIRAGAGCTLSGRTVRCAAAGVSEIVLDAGDRDDRISIARPVGLRTRLRGGSGNDVLSGGGGPDELDGGAGRDVVTYEARTEPLAITIADGANDGAAGEGDDVLAVEQLVGGAGADVLTGSGAGERIEGRAGNDRIDGRGGGDVLAGGLDDDTLLGGDGDDVFAAASSRDGADTMSGGSGGDRADYSARGVHGVVADPDGLPDDGERPGGQLSAVGPVPSIAALAAPESDNLMPDVEHVRGTNGDDVLAAGQNAGRLDGLRGTDVLRGGPGRDRLDGGQGFDRLLARDRTLDTVICGSEGDRAFVDGSDRPGADCESKLTSFAVTLAPVRRTAQDGTLPVRVSCPPQAAVRCVGAVRVVTFRRLRTPGGRLRFATLGAARFNVPAGTALDVPVRLTESGRATLGRLGGATRVRLAARGRDEAGQARPAATRFVLRNG